MASVEVVHGGGGPVGTPDYMAPELWAGEPATRASDIYALGVVMHELLTGKLPYPGTDSLSTALAHLTEPLPELPINHGRYQDILRKLLAKNPDERYQTAEEFAQAIKTTLSAAPANAMAGAAAAASSKCATWPRRSRPSRHWQTNWR